tara:strand:+ start:1467 stop:2276 length:810 start_codon:yes stop_codon:yes gene_type:complete
MFQNPLSQWDELNPKEKTETHEDMEKVLRAHGDVIIDQSATLDLWLKVMVPDTTQGLPYTALPLPVPFMAATHEDGVATIRFLFLGGATRFRINGEITDVDAPALGLEENESIDWTLDGSVCFYANYFNMEEHYKDDFSRRKKAAELVKKGNQAGQAEAMSYEDESLAWFDELVFEWFTTTTDPGKFYAWRNGVVRLFVALSPEERAKRLASWRSGETRRGMPNNEKFADWKSVGFLERVQVDFTMPISSVSTFAITKKPAAGKRGRIT